MKIRRILFCFISFLIFSAIGLQAAELENDKDLVDVVVEWSPEDHYLQVGDYTISEFGEIFVINKEDQEIAGDEKDFYIGAVVQAQLADQDENGFWHAEKMTILKGEAQKNVLAKLTSEEMDLAIGNAGSRESGDKKQHGKNVRTRTRSRNHSTKTVLKFRDGVWTN